MGALPIVKGVKLRATKIDSCGKPIQGPANRLVTDGFMSVRLDPVMKDRQELEQTNAEGRVIFTDTTPATRKHHNVAVQLCGVDPDLWSLFTGYSRVLDYDGTPIGIADKPDVDGDFGVALELWTGGVGDDDCPVPVDDSIFSLGGSGKSHGYLLLGATEWVPSGFSVEAGFADFTLSGITRAMPHWGRGPYNVARIDSSGTAGRLLVPVDADRHYTFFRTPIAPPEATKGAVALSVQSIFTAPDYYFGASAADVAPAQVDTQTLTLAITGSPAGGNFTLLVNGVETATIAYNAAASAVKTAIVGVADGFVAADFVTAGGALPTTAVTITAPVGVTLAVGTVALTGGTAPAVTLT